MLMAAKIILNSPKVYSMNLESSSEEVTPNPTLTLARTLTLTLHPHSHLSP